MSVGSGRVKAVSGRLPEQFTVRPPRARVRPELRTSPAGCGVVAAPTGPGSHHGVAARFRMNVVIRRRFVLTQSAAAGPEPASRTLTPPNRTIGQPEGNRLCDPVRPLSPEGATGRQQKPPICSGFLKP